MDDILKNTLIIILFDAEEYLSEEHYPLMGQKSNLTVADVTYLFR